MQLLGSSVSVRRARRAYLSAAVLAGLLGFASLARADRVGDYYVAPLPAADFWEQAIEPHGADVRVVLEKVNQIIQQLPYYYDSDPTGVTRERIANDGLGMLRYARRLAPKNPEVLRNLGVLADETGRSELALEAFQAYLGEVEDEAQIPADVFMRLGRIHGRLREYDDAIRYLRKSLVAPIASAGYYYSYSQGHALVALASVLTASGRLADALDTLETYSARVQYYGDESSIQGGFALAVAYDRDEQRANAFDMLDLLINASQGSYGSVAYNALSHLSFTPAIEQHYYFALLYESLGYLSEARVEWGLYARGGDEALFRGRALDHVAAIDRMLEEKLVKDRAAAKAAKGRGALVPGLPLPPTVFP